MPGLLYPGAVLCPAEALHGRLRRLCAGGADGTDVLDQQGDRAAAVSRPQAAERLHAWAHGLDHCPQCAVDGAGPAGVLPAQRTSAPAPARWLDLRLSA